jgi:succinate-acetate transporter protein
MSTQAEMRIERSMTIGPAGAPAPSVMLQPIAAPSILGLFGFAGATFIVAANLAGWYGTPSSPMELAPFAAAFGGLAQLLAGMWAYRARDGIATAAHGMWGSFWIAYGILWLLMATHTVPSPTPWYHATELGWWFFALAIITASCFLAALFENVALSSVLLTLTVGSAILAYGLIDGSHTTVKVAGWVLVASAGLAWYVATGLMLKGVTGRELLPMFKTRRAAMNHMDDPAQGHTLDELDFPWAEPGIKHGQ